MTTLAAAAHTTFWRAHDLWETEHPDPPDNELDDDRIDRLTEDDQEPQ
ncbi:hypothetical protein GCM10025864_44880 [Luteimicrobium album]|uniref:Uncharacterized protein n=1 Tax=Luteimicrobium album TaxID=1054550 RepID=A0ABQ6HWA7_9MICO|nr:hypothetical protein [Luteimicrobium album]GMA22262.1 hypothetical protein GCM10025864_00210 [Luteimicrobium album]GMA26667.1 hypothetical protein GCM10025864_44260 [Luteimicrobium album]GMA26729.1 hypothetical protein GCM10025864_44880 [Luteimicrobium album]